MIITDGRHLGCTAGDEVALHQFAKKLGLRRSRYGGAMYQCYDINASQYDRAVLMGAEIKSPDEFRASVKLFQQMKEPAAQKGGSSKESDDPNFISSDFDEDEFF